MKKSVLKATKIKMPSVVEKCDILKNRIDYVERCGNEICGTLNDHTEKIDYLEHENKEQNKSLYFLAAVCGFMAGIIINNLESGRLR